MNFKTSLPNFKRNSVNVLCDHLNKKVNSEETGIFATLNLPPRKRCLSSHSLPSPLPGRAWPCSCAPLHPVLAPTPLLPSRATDFLPEERLVFVFKAASKEFCFVVAAAAVVVIVFDGLKNVTSISF